MLASPRLRGVLAAVILLLAVAGLPLALAATVGNPLQSWPSLTDGQLTDTGIIAVLATVFWLAWLSFTVPAVLEIALTVISKLTRRPQRHLRLPLLGAQQDLARNLVSAVLLLLPAASPVLSAAAAPVNHQTTTTIAATALAGDSSRAPAAQPAQDRHRPDSATRRYVIPDVGGMRSYWALAEHYLGDGARWREIWQLNEGCVHSDGSVMNSPRQLHAGWTILLPAAAGHREDDPAAPPRQITVRPGDTLSTIAASDGISDWRQVWTLNADRREPENVRFSDPDLIRPGWRITLPDAGHDRGVASKPATGRQSTNGNDSAHHNGPRPLLPTPAATRPAHPDAGSPAPPPSATSSEPNGTLSSAPTTPTTAAPSRDASTHDERDHTDHRFPIVPLEIGLAAAASIVALDRARRIAQRRRRVGHRPLPPPAHLVEVEAQIRRDARRAHPTVAAISLATALTGTHPVRIRTVVARADGAVDLQLADPIPPPPPPFLEVTGGWRLPADATAFGFAADDPDELDDPCPALIPVGTTVDGQVLVDLDVTGPISIAGEPEAVEALLRQLVTALAAAPWAGRVQVHVPPRFAERLGPLERLTVEDSLSPRPPAGQPDGSASPDDVEEPGWRTTPVHLYCGWVADADLDPVLRAAAAGSSHVHLIVNGANPDTATWTLDGDQLTLPNLAEPVTVSLPEPTAPDPHDLLHFTATAPDVPVEDPRLPDLTAATRTPDDANVTSDAGVDVQPDASAQPRRLLLLGPVELAGAERRSQVLNLLTFLALHPRGVDRHQLLAALWPDETIALQSMRNMIRKSRLLVDGGITDGPIWRLTDAVTTDWQQFSSLATGGIDQQRQALELVRGRPFAGLDDADWIDLGGFRSEVEAAIVDVALTIAEHDLATENYPGALAAARSGLLASRYEERLHRAAIRAAVAQGLHGLAKTLQQEMRTVLDLDVEPDDQIQPETLALIRDVRDCRPVSSDSAHR